MNRRTALRRLLVHTPVALSLPSLAAQAGERTSLSGSYPSPDRYLTGLSDFDALTGGLPRTRVVSIFGRPENGANQLASDLARRASWRAGATAVVSRPADHRGVGGAPETVEEQYGWGAHPRRAISVLDDHLYPTLDDLRTFAFTVSARAGKRVGCMAVVEPMLLRSADTRLPMEGEALAAELCQIATEFRCAVLLALTLPCVRGRPYIRPGLSDVVGDHCRLAQHSEIVVFIHRPELYDPEDVPGMLEVDIAANRGDQTGCISIPLTALSLNAKS